MEMHGVYRIYTAWVSFMVLTISDATQFLEGRQGTIGAGNYTYYKLSALGNIRIILHSVSGDADIYISETTQQPTFEDYDLRSTTCGPDEVHIPEWFKRPVWVGVYGYIFPDVSSYQMLIYRLSSDDFILDYIPDSPYEEDTTNADKPHVPKIHQKVPEEGESLLWSIFVGFLKILLDVLL